MIRVAQVMGKMFGGGVESVVMNYYRHIDRSRVQFDLLVCSDSGLVPTEEVESLGGSIIEVPPYENVLAYQRELKRVLSQGDWPIVHSHLSTLSVFSLRAAKAAGVPVRIAHSHMAWSSGISVKSLIERSLCHFSNLYPTARLACSREAGEWLFGKRVPVDLMYNAIDLDRFAFSKSVRDAERARLGIAEDAFVVGHIGRFSYQKNHPFLLRAFEELLALREDAVLVLAGGGSNDKRLDAERWVSAHGLSDKVVFVDFTEFPERLYCAFDVFALPSFFEGLCVVGIEAQAAGLPCILSDRTTREANVSGTVQYLPIDDPRLWAEALAQIERGSRISVNREQFSSYDIVQAGAWLTDYYERLAEQSRTAN